MKKKLLLMLFLVFYNVISLRGQGLCENATQISGTSVIPGSLVISTFTDKGYNLGCANAYGLAINVGQQRPTWLYCVVGQPGTINMNFTNSANNDVDWVVWGPFAPNRTIANICSSDMDLLPPVFCDVLPSPNAVGSITPTLAGQIYIIMVTNYTGTPTNCSLAFSGTGSFGLAPSIACPSNITVSNTAGQCGANVSFSATETVGIPASAITYSPASGSFFPVGTTTVTATATNSIGSSSCSFTVTVNDTEAPAILPSVPSPVTLNYADRMITYTGVSINGGGTSRSVAPGSSVSLAYGMSVSFNYSTGYCPGCVVQSYVGIGGTNQTLQCEQYISNGYSVNRSVNFTAPVAPGIYYITQNGSLDYQCNLTSFDNAAANAIGVIVVGSASVCPANITVNATAGQCGANVSWAAPVASDNCGIQSFVSSPISGANFPIGTTPVTYTATDAAGNTTSCSFTVTVVDNQPPVLTCSGPVSLQCPGAFELTPPTITDNCGVGLTNGPIISTNGSFSSGGASWNMCGNNVESLPETFYGGSDGSNMTAEIDHQPVTLCQNINGFIVGQTYQLTFRASRRTGAPATVGAIVTIDGGALNTTVLRSNGPFSLTAETFSFVATQATHQLKFVPSGGWGGTVGFIVDDIAVRGQFVSVNNAPASFPYGNTTVTWTATDVNGNTATCDQIVSVVDTQAPVFASPLTANSYVFSTTTGVALEDLSAGATTIFGSGVDDASVTSVLPFTFNYKSINFTNLGVSSNGVLIPNGNTSNYINNTNDAGMTNALFPFWDDLVTGSDGSVRTKVVGTAPNRKFVVEWKDNLYVDGLSAFTTPYKITLQAWLFEGSNVIQYVYGNNTGAVNFSGTIGLKGSNASDFNEVTTLHGSSTSSINDNYNLWPGNGRSYVFTPNGCPADILVNADAGQCGANVSFAAIVTDNCGTPTVTYSPASGSFFAIGTTPVTVTATDASGNSTTCSFTVTVDLLNLVNLQWPPSATICQGGSLTAYGQVYEPGVTTLGYGIQGANIEAQFGYATSNTDPATWSSWSPATFNALANWPDKNEYFIDFTPPTSGTFYYTFRFRQNGCAWQYGGYNVSGGGFWNGTTAVSGVLTVDPTTVGGSVSGGTSICPGFTSSELTLSGHTGSIARWESSVAPFITWDPIAVTITTYTSGALAETTRFRAVVQSGVCLSVASDYTEVEVYLTYPFYADTDSDGYGAGPVVILCSDSASNAPAGYSVDGTDCDDSDDTKHATFPFYVDADGDGYGAVGSASVQLCAVDGATPPEPNYSVNDDDCNDLVFAINPGVAEIAFDSIDNDCDGSLFNGLTPIVVNVLSPSCGGINHGLNNTINCTEIYLGEGYVIGYRFKVTNLATGEVDYVDTVQHHFKLTDTDIYSYGTAFSIQVAAIVNGEVQPYNGATCTLTTTTVATTKVVTAQCGSTLTYMYSTINANSVSSTNLYRFRIARVDAPTTYYLIERTVPNFNLTMVTGLPLTYATEYKVDVQIRVKLAGFTAWSQYGQVCSIFSPPFPTSSIVLSQCEMTATSNSQVIYATPYAGATTYRFLLTGYDGLGEVNYSQYQDSPTPSFTLSMFSGLTPGATYTVTVSMELYGSFVPYDKDCSITTPLPARELEPTKVTDVFKATAYPNPFANNFMIAVTSSSSSTVAIKVYDMVGRLVEQRDVKFAELANSTIGERYPSGVYNIVVTQDDTVEVVRVVKR